MSANYTPITPQHDPHNMMRQHLITRALKVLDKIATKRRQYFTDAALLNQFSREKREALSSIYGDWTKANYRVVKQPRFNARIEQDDFTIEHLALETLPGWEAAISVFIPKSGTGPHPVIIVPCGHGPRTHPSHQQPAQIFARHGFMTILIEPPGFGEKDTGSCHFNDGVRLYPLGQTSSQFFVADPIYCIDYLATRPDADLTSGVAMTGVSGGGVTTALAACLDDRITVAGLACGVAPMRDLDINDCYAGCPETHFGRRLTLGLEDTDIVCAIAPRPLMLMNGAQDELYTPKRVQPLTEDVLAFYNAHHAADRLEVFTDDCPHNYSDEMAFRFIGFAKQHLLGQTDPAINRKPVGLLTEDQLCSAPDPEKSMLGCAVQHTDELSAIRTYQPPPAISCPDYEMETSDAFPIGKHHYWQSVQCHLADHLEFPATWLPLQEPATTSQTIIALDDRGRHALLQQAAPLASLLRSAMPVNILSVDLPGWGETTPQLYPYETLGWANPIRWLSYTATMLGDSLMDIRVRSAIALIDWLQKTQYISLETISIFGHGLGGIVALLVAEQRPGIHQIITQAMPASLSELVKAPQYSWSDDCFIPNLLQRADFTEISASLPCPVTHLNPLDANRTPLTEATIAHLNQQAGSNCYQPDRELAEFFLQQFSPTAPRTNPAQD